MPPNDPNAYKVPGDPRSGLLSSFAGNMGTQAGNMGTQPVNPFDGPTQVQRSGSLEQEVIDGYMTLTPQEKKMLLGAMNSALGGILMKVLPDQLGGLIREAIDTPPERIGAGTTLPRTGVQ